MILESLDFHLLGGLRIPETSCSSQEIVSFKPERDIGRDGIVDSARKNMTIYRTNEPPGPVAIPKNLKVAFLHTQELSPHLLTIPWIEVLTLQSFTSMGSP
jgi:hypothetical protein